MKNILTYDNLVVFDGMIGTFKQDISLDPSQSVYRKDLDSLLCSTVIGFDDKKIIKKQDIVWFFDKWGTIQDIDYDEDQVSIEIATGSDMYQRKLFNLGSTNILDNFIVNNRQPVNVILNTMLKYIQESGTTAYSDEVFRKVMISNQLKEINDYALKAVVIQVDDSPDMNIRRDEPSLNWLRENISEDTTNELILINKDNPIQYTNYFLNENTGVVNTNPISLQRPAVTDTMDVEATEWNDINVAIEYFKKQEYANEIVFETNYPNSSYDETMLGRRINYIALDEKALKTKITKIIISVGKMEITLGTSRNRLDDILRGD